MFLRYFVELELPLDEAIGSVTSLPPGWLPEAADDAQAKADRMLVELGLLVRGLRLERFGRLELSDWVWRPGRGGAVRLTWTADHAQALLPVVDGQMELAPLGPRRTLLGLSAQYDPPLGWVGRQLDRLLMHHVAEAVAQDFVASAARRLLEHAEASDGPRPTGTFDPGASRPSTSTV